MSLNIVNLYMYTYIFNMYYVYYINVLTWTSPQPRWSSRSVHPAMPSWWMLCTPDDFQKVTVRRRRRWVQRRYISYRSPSVPLSGCTGYETFAFADQYIIITIILIQYKIYSGLLSTDERFLLNFILNDFLILIGMPVTTRIVYLYKVVWVILTRQSQNNKKSF